MAVAGEDVAEDQMEAGAVEGRAADDDDDRCEEIVITCVQAVDGVERFRGWGVLLVCLQLFDCEMIRVYGKR